MGLVVAVSQVRLARLIAVVFLFRRSPRSLSIASTGVVLAEAGIDLIKTPEQLKSPGFVRGFFCLTLCWGCWACRRCINRAKTAKEGGFEAHGPRIIFLWRKL